METEPTVCKVHEVVSIKIPFEGRPTPDVTWSKVGKTIFSDAGHKILSTSSSTTLMITDAARSDSGFYNVTVKNRYVVITI